MKRKTKFLQFLLVFCMAFSLTGCFGGGKSCAGSPPKTSTSPSDDKGNSSTDKPPNENPFVPTEEPTVEVPIRNLATEKLFTINDGATTMLASVGTGKGEHKGVLLAPKSATTGYEGAFNGVFNDSLKLTFSFPGTCDRKVGDMPNGNFFFRMTDVTDQDNWVEIEYYVATANWYMGAVVRDSKGNQRTTRYHDSHIYTYKTTESEGAWFGYFGQDNVASTTLELKWGADVLSVLTSNPMRGVGADAMKLIAKFDGTTEINETESQFGVEKVSFPYGYTLSFRSSFYADNVTPVRFENIVETDRTTLSGKETSLAESTVDYTPVWYEKYQNNYSKVTIDGTYETQYVQGETVQIFNASYSYPAMADFENKPIEKIEWKKPNASEYEKITATEMMLDQAGVYTIRYTAVRKSTRAGNVVIKQFEVLRGTFNTQNLVTITSGDATVKSGAQGEGNKKRSGILISPSTSTTAFAGTLNGVFTGNLKIKLAFPGKLGTNGYSLDGEVEFRIQDVANEANYFDVIFYNGRKDWGNAICIRDNKGNYRTVSPGGTWANTKSYVGLAGYFGQDDRESSTFLLNWSLDFLSVKATDANGENERTIARFDGTSAYNPDINAYGLEKMVFPSGYKISFKSLCSGNRVSPIIFEEIGSANLGNKVLEEQPPWYNAYQSQIKITVDGIYDNLYASGDEIDIYNATYCYPQQENSVDAPVSKIEVNVNSSGYQKIDAGKLTLQSGMYVIRYTAVSGMSNVGNTYEVNFQVSNSLFELLNLISVSEGGATKTAGTSVVGEAGIHEGVLVQPSSATTAYSGKINGVFTGNSKVAFSMPTTPTDAGNTRKSADGFVEFTITDKDDASNFFKIVFRNYNPTKENACVYLVDKHGQIRSFGTYYMNNDWHQASTNMIIQSTAQPFSKDAPSNYFELSWADDVLSVYRSNSKDGRSILAKFDGTYDTAKADNGFVVGKATVKSGIAIEDSDTQWGLEKFNPANGYTISFTSRVQTDEEKIQYMLADTKVTPIVFESINDIALRKYVDVETTNGEVVVPADKTVSATLDTRTAEDLNLYTTMESAAKIGTLSIVGTSTKVYADISSVDLTTPGTYQVNYNGATANVIVSADNATFTANYRHSVTFENNFAMNYYIPVVNGCSSATMVIGGKTLNGVLTDIDSGKAFKFSYADVAAAEIGNTITTGTLTVTKGEVTFTATNVDTYSIKAYAYERLENSQDAKFKTLLVDVLNYCASAQTYFDYDVENLVNADLTEDQKALASTTPTLDATMNLTEKADATATFYGATVVFKSSVEMNFYVSGASDGNVLAISYTGTDGVKRNEEIPLVKAGDYYVATYAGMSAVDFGKDITAVIKSGNTEISATLTYSVEAYAVNRLAASTSDTFKALLDTMMKYSASASAYFAK